MAFVRIELKTRIGKVVSKTHSLPLHLDECATWWLMVRWIHEEFVKKHMQKGVIWVGAGGGPLDEHFSLSSPRKKGECAATLTAKELGIQDDPCLEEILEDVKLADLQGSGRFAYLDRSVRLLSQQGSPQEAFEYVKRALDLEYGDMQGVWTGETPNEYQRIAQVLSVQAGNRQVKIVILPSDNPYIGRYARAQKGGGADVTIQQQNSGHIQIVAKRISLRDVARLVWIAERQAKGLLEVDDSIYRLIRLAGEGTVEGAEGWYLGRGNNALSNGKTSGDNDHVPATKLPLDQIVAIVKLGLDWSQLSPDEGCPKSRCLFKGCSWYFWGLERCEDIRQRSSASRRR